MKNFVFISPDFPSTYYMFTKALKEDGFNVLAIGGTPYENLRWELKDSVNEYYRANLENYDEVANAIRYFEWKYGHIDYLESNNEYWLRQDARLRDQFNIEGMRVEDVNRYQRKSLMKACFEKAGVKVARYVVINDENKDQLYKFAEEVGYPLFTKPDIGVGAQGGYKLSNIDDVTNFLNKKPWGIDYIAEQYVTGHIQSYDGIADSESNVIFADNEFFPPSVSEVVKSGADMFYYCAPTINKEFDKIGRNVVKAFNIKNRFFHIEFFKLDIDIKGLGKKGDIVALEANLRAPGGYTPDLINFARSVNVYKIWADSLAFNKTYEKLDHEKFYAACASRRYGYNYRYSHDDIMSKYWDKICAHGVYPDILSDDLGNIYYMAKFKTKKEMIEFRDFVLERV